MLRHLAIVSAFLLSLSASADPREFVLAIRAPQLQQGIMTVEADGSLRPFANFNLSNLHDSRGFALAAFHDRVVVQGTALYDFDRSSGQLLRRYAALAPGFDTWAFHGAAVDEDDALTLGIEPGYYGTVRCPLARVFEIGDFCRSPVTLFPGYAESSTRSEEHVLLRRGLRPDDPSLHLVKTFAAEVDGSRMSTRFTSIDRVDKRFRFWVEGSSSSGRLRQLTSAPFGPSGVADEIVERELTIDASSPAEARRYTTSFAFDDVRRSIWRADYLYAPPEKEALVRETLNGNVEFSLIKSDTYFNSVAVAPEVEPQRHTQLIPAIAEARGAYGTWWRSDAWLFNPSDSPMEIELERVTRPGVVTPLTIPAHASVKMPNLLVTLGGGPTGDGRATDAVIVRSPYRAGAQLVVNTRTWTPASEGGSYGQAIQAMPTDLGYSNHLPITTTNFDPAIIPLERGVPGQFRHNLGVVNVSDEVLTLKLRLRGFEREPDEPDDPAQDFYIDVAPHSLGQFSIESLFPPGVLENTHPFLTIYGDRPAATWLSIIDNLSGDATFVPFTVMGLSVHPESRLALPAVAHLGGANGTFWRTDAYGLFNLYGGASGFQEPDANFYSMKPGCSAATQKLEVSNDFRFADLARQFCPEGDASGVLEVNAESWTAMFSRTYTTREDGGTYGEMLPLYPARGWPERHMAGIELGAAARVNVGLYNGADVASKIRLRLFRADGTLAAENVVAMTPRESMQRPLREFFSSTIEDGLYAISFTTIEGVGCWPYVSTVDEKTGDPTNWW